MSLTVAEREGFEPSLREYRKPDFESGAFDQLCHLSGLVAANAVKLIIIADKINSPQDCLGSL